MIEETLEEFLKKTFTNCGDLDREIEKLENNIPDKRKKEFIEYRSKINYLYKMYNGFAKFKVYKLI